MSPLALILRNLRYFRGSSLALVAGMAVATAALAGSLMVGDSVRGSLRTLAIQRLGPVDYVLTAGQFFDDSQSNALAARVMQKAGGASAYDVAPAIITAGSASTPRGDGGGKVRTGDVQIIGVGGDATGGAWPAVPAGSAWINSEVRSALASPGAKSERQMAFTFPSKEDAARESIVARRGVDETSASLSVRSAVAIPQHHAADMLERFNLQGSQRTPRNAWVNLKELQDAIQQPRRANVLLARDKTVELAALSEQEIARRSMDGSAKLNEALRDVVQLPDYGLSVQTSKATGERVIGTSSTYLSPPIVTAAEEAGKKLGFTPRFVTVNLVNRVIVTDEKGVAAKDAKALHYVIGAGISSLDDAEEAANGAANAETNPTASATAPASRPSFAASDIAFNLETAQQLGVKIGDHVRIDYFRRDADGVLTEVTSAEQGLVFRVSRILAMKGIGADTSLTPVFAGLTDADSVSDWRPPAELKIDEKLAEKDNDAYWKKHKSAPRLFIHLDAARTLWKGPYGDVTSVRVPADKADAYTEVLRRSIDPASLGFVFQPVKLHQLAASAGSTDFSMLFIGFSFFLIAAAALLVAMLFRLNVEQRVKQFGLMSAAGFAPRKLRWLALGEGAVLAMVGGAVGVIVGVAYTAVIVHGLRTWWVGAIGTTALELHVRPVTLWAGFIFGFWVAMMAVLWAAWRLGKQAPVRLMAGQLTAEPRGVGKTGRFPRVIAIVLAIVGLAILGAVLAGVIRQPEVALGGGAALLAAGLCWLGGSLRPRVRTPGQRDVRSVAMLGFRNANRHTARSVLSVGLIAFAAFTLITVASMEKTGADDTGNKAGGAGGYRLIVQAGVPVLSDLNTPTGRHEAGFVGAAPNDAAQNEAAPFGDWSSVRFVPLRRWAGQDISCLNLTRPTSPTILGVPKALTSQNRFGFARMTEKVENPWSLLEKPQADGAVPVIADNETAQYILKLGLGDTIEITDQLGRKRPLRLVATLSHSIFQSELLMAEETFRELFPAQAGAGTLLVECPADQVQAVQQALNAEMEPYAVSVDTTAARLEAYQQIQNTYLSTFKTLGSLGLALGTLGLAVVLIRNVIERRGELALLAAIGFSPRDRVRLVLSENILLLVLGLGVGTACALLGIVPTLIASKSGINLGGLAATLLAVLTLGLLSSVIAVRLSGLRAAPADLRSE